MTAGFPVNVHLPERPNTNFLTRRSKAPKGNKTKLEEAIKELKAGNKGKINATIHQASAMRNIPSMPPQSEFTKKRRR